MKLLIVTQKVDINDDVLGFFHGWLLEFAKQFEKVTVICLYEGEHNLPKNVKVLSLGKNELSAVSYRLKALFRFYKYIWQERKNYNKVFVHMNQIYVILGGLAWKSLGKKIGLWYAHGSVPFGLRVANKIVDYIFTSTESGFRINSKKKEVVGQGVDTDLFKPNEFKKNNEVFEIVTVGRVSKVKDYITLLKAVDLVKDDFNLKLNIIGGTIYKKDSEYKEELEKIIEERKLENIVNFVGSVANYKLINHLQKNDLFVNTSHTGSLDKTVLEAMSTGLPVLNCNEALLEVFGGFTENLMFPKKDSETLSVKIKEMYGKGGDYRNNLGLNLRNIVKRKHSIENLINKIKEIYE